jgi:hypothetical protein
MAHVLRFGDVVEAADQLTLEEQEELLDIVKKRMIARRRTELLRTVEEADADFREGRCRAMTADEIVTGIFT